MSTTTTERRQFLSKCTSGLMSLIGALLSIPALGYVLAVTRGKSAGMSTGMSTGGADASLADAGSLSNVPIGAWTSVSFEVVQQDGWEQSRQKHAVWVHRNGASDSDVTVLSPICPHLGCPVNWHADRSEFICPCHGGVFDQQGRFVSGPPPRSMDALEFEVRNGKLLVQWRDFKIGVSQRVPVQL
jgi:menaquinol-cytochrome c reductase iron-sulfur subunit